MTVYALDPSLKHDLHLSLYKNIKDYEALLDKTKKGGLQCAIINAKYIYSPFQIVVAANKAALSSSANSMVTKNIYSEIIFNLSPSRNIKKSFSQFGIEEKPGVVFVAILKEKNGDISAIDEILSQIEGELCLDDPCIFRNVEGIKKTYAITNDQNILSKIVSICATKS